MALLLLVGGDVILMGSEARIWKKGTVHCILLSSGRSGGESLTCGPPKSGIAPNHPWRATLWSAKIPFSLLAFAILTSAVSHALISVSRSPSSCRMSVHFFLCTLRQLRRG
jgi:hypothetical protein